MIHIGNHITREKILRDSDEKKLTHALLLSGPAGTGKFLFLQEIAEKILGRQKNLPPELVQVSDLYTDGDNNDLAKLAKVSTFDQSHRKKSKKKTDSIGVDDLESFTQHLHETIVGDWKILLIRDIERMTLPASNKFLKILEEPPAKTFFLMTSSHEKKLLPTVVSRVRRENFSLVPSEHLENFLGDVGGNFSAEEKKSLVFLANGRGRFLQEMMDNPENFEAQKTLLVEVEGIFSASNLGKINFAEILAKKALPEIQTFLSMSLLVLQSQLQPILKKNSEADISHHIQKIESVIAGQKNIAKNGNKRMVLEEVLLKL